MNTAVFVFVNDARVGKCFRPYSDGEESIITLLIVKWSKGELGLLGVLSVLISGCIKSST